MKKRKKKKISIKGFLFILLIIYLLGSFIYYVFTRPIKNILVINNHYVSSKTILEEAGLNNNPTLLKPLSYLIKSRLNNNKLIESVDVKKSIFGKITIDVKENNPLFINNLNNNVVLSDSDVIELDNTYLGLPVLINYVPSDIYEDLIKGLSKIDMDILYKISEIEYSPDKNENIVFDDARFLLRMKDTNIVYVNTPNIKKLNNYNTIYSETGSGGTLLLDSNSANYIFKKK